MGSTEYTTDKTLTQTRFWLGPFVTAGFFIHQDSPQAVTCPTVLRRVRDDVRANWQVGGMLSYAYSAALFTDSALWDPAAPGRRDTPDRFRKSVGLYEVMYPSQKVAMFEIADHHGTNERADDAARKAGARLNAAFADSHVARVAPAAAARPLSVPWTGIYDPAVQALPYSASAGGYLGRDY